MSSFFFPVLTRRTAHHLSGYATISCFSESTKGAREENNVFVIVVKFCPVQLLLFFVLLK